MDVKGRVAEITNVAFARRIIWALRQQRLEDLIISHLDEEPHWGKLWNLTLGAGLPIRHLSAGHNIPGDFWEAAPKEFLSGSFPGLRSIKTRNWRRLRPSLELVRFSYCSHGRSDCGSIPFV